MISIKNLTKKYGEKTVLDNIDLVAESGKITVVLGESGAGKTTLLNAIAGLTSFDGEIEGDFKPLSFVFQQDRLIPNLTVSENISIVNKTAKVSDALLKVGLIGCENALPKTLSAGMKKRVNILRAWLFPSKTVLMDEPFSGIDIKLKFAMIDEIKRQVNLTGRTVLAVTHDIKEAARFADRVIVLLNGKIVYDNPSVSEKTEEELLSFMLNLGEEK